VEELRMQYANLFPDAIKTLLSLDKQIAPSKEPKRYYLSKVPHKLLGFVYYVRYLEGGKLVPSRWTTGTNNLELAEQFAVKNRERLLSAYHERKSTRDDLYARLAGYYEAGSECLREDEKRGRRMNDHSRRQSLGTVMNDFIPFLKENKVQSFPDVTVAIAAQFQTRLSSKGVSPQTVNRNMSAVSAMFKQFLSLGLVASNPFKQVERLKTSDETTSDRGCHDIEKTLGVFDERWDDPTELLLCLLIYSAGVRNVEIRRAVVGDVFARDGVWFLNIPKSKTKNGERVTPLHPFVLSKLDLSRPPDAPLVPLPGNPDETFASANRSLGYKLGMLPEQLEKENITFYSGRHFYKTMLNDGRLGDAEEYFMGHRASSDVSKLYNHRDRQGRKKLVEVSATVFEILDRRLFDA
jgi:integrase